MEPDPPPLRLFGVPTLRTAAGAEQVFVPERPQQLLALLACRGDWVARAELADWLWQDRRGDAALSNLRKVLLLAQRWVAAQGAPAIEQRPGLLHWAPDNDLRAFERACDAQQPERALALATAPLLQSLDTGLSPAALEWLDFERARLAARWRTQAARRLAQLDDQPDDAAELAQRLLLADPTDEAALEALVRARQRLGQGAQARRELQAHGERLRAEYGVEPSARLRALGQALQQHAEVPLRAAAPPSPHAAPAGFVGRRLELMQLRDWLAQERRRVVSLTGPGGIGKSSLARALLAEWPVADATTAVWVGLADVRQIGELPLRVAAALGLPAAGAATADDWAPVRARLATGAWLLVLDNGEQLEGLAAAVAKLLAAHAALQVLNVSRQSLSLPGEWLLPLEGLPLPDADEQDVSLLRRNDAVVLFDQRARAVAPGFELARQVAEVVHFVRAVEGLPLAIEIGASLVRLLPVAQIDEAVTAAHGLPALDTSFALSWNSLSPNERRALRALALLPGDVDRHWAEQVAGAPLALLAALVDKSLLGADGRGRFGLHPLLRRWLAQREADAAADEALAQRHAAHVALTLERLGRPGGAGARELVDTLRAEWSHVSGAWAWAISRRDAGFMARVVPVLQRFFELQGGWQDALAMFARAIAAWPEPGDAEARRALMHLHRASAALLVRCARHAEGEAQARLGLRLAQQAGDATLVSACLTTLGLSVFSRGHYAQARPIFEQTVRRSRALGDPVRIDVALGNLAIAELALGRFEPAAALFDELVSRGRARGEASALIVYLGNAGEARRGLGDWAGARAAHAEALALCDRHGVRSRRVTKLLNLAAIDHAEGRLTEAAQGLEAAMAEAQAGGDRSNEGACWLSRAALRIDRGEPEAATGDLIAGLQLALDIDSEDLMLRAALVHGECCLARGHRAEGRAWVAWALAQPALYAVERVAATQRLRRRGLEPDASWRGAAPAASAADAARVIVQALQPAARG